MERKSILKLYRIILQRDSALLVGLKSLVNGILQQQLGTVLENCFQFFKENNQKIA